MRKICRTLFSPDCYKLVLLVVSIAHVCPLLGVHMDPYLKLLHIYAAAVIVFDLLGERRILKNKGRTILFVFVLCYGVTLLCNPNLINFSGISNFCYYFACLALVYSYGENSAKWDRITSAIIVSLITAAGVVGIWMFYTKFHLYVSGRGYIGMYPAENRLAGLFGNPNMQGLLCMGAICLCFIRFVKSGGKLARTLYLTAGVVNYITMLLSNSRTAIYACVGLFAIYVFLRVLQAGKSIKKILLALVAAVLTAAVLYFGGVLIQKCLSLLDVNYEHGSGMTIQRERNDIGFNGRGYFWENGVKIFIQQPLFGYGMDNYEQALLNIGVPAYWAAYSMHNSYLEALVCLGAAGFLCAIAFLIVVAKSVVAFLGCGEKEEKSYIACLTSCCIGFLAVGMMESVLMASISPIGVMFWFVTAQLVCAIESENKKMRCCYPGPFCLLAEKFGDRREQAGKRVCFVNDSLGGGGAEQTLVNVANALQENGYDVTVITLWSGGVLESRLNEKVELRTMDPFDVFFFKRVQHWINRHCMPRRLYNFFFIDYRYDFTVAFMEGLSTRLIAEAKLKPNGKRFAWVHTDLKTQNWVLPFYKSVDEQRALYQRYDRIFCVSESTRDVFIDVMGCEDKALTLYNLMDTDRILELAQEKCPERKPEGILVAAVGRLNDQKGFDRLVSVIGRLRKQSLDITLWIIGEGAKRAELEQQIKATGLENNVKLMGFQNNPYCFAAEADVFVLSSRVEGFGLVIAENLLLGKPIVATLCAGVREQLGDDEYGIVTENNEEALHEGLYRMLTDEKLRNHYAEKALERGRDMSYDVLLGKLLEQF